MNKVKVFLILLIITVPAFIGLFNNEYFAMHDDQHIARLSLLDQGIKQGDFYPRWVDTLGFNFGYPLFNFYPPFIYYTAEVFHLLGFSFIWSMKIVVIIGFLTASGGMYLLAREFVDRNSSFVTSTLCTYFSYRAVVVYVRGAPAEFIAMSILPFLFLSIFKLAQKQSFKNTIFFAGMFALLIIAHPLIAFPSVFFIGAFFLFNVLKKNTNKKRFVYSFIHAGLWGLSFSAFFWLPSMVERKFTLVDSILTKELASYAIHFVYPGQFIYSPWGYGGSIQGPVDGMSFALGRIHIILFICAFILSFFYILQRKASKKVVLAPFFFFVSLSLFSIYMTTEYSLSIWQGIKQLSYLQFPWRFLSIAAIFISLTGAFTLYFVYEIFKKTQPMKIIAIIFAAFLILPPIIVYKKYFKPKIIKTSDKELTRFEEIAWRVSRTSHEFAPRGVRTKKTELATTIIDMSPEKVKKEPYEIIDGSANVKTIKNNFAEKSFSIITEKSTQFRLNTFNFPGWTSYVDGDKKAINDLNDYKLITIDLPPGTHEVIFKFENTPIRTVSNLISGISLGFVIIFLAKSARSKRKI